MSLNTSKRNFTLGQTGNKYDTRLRTSSTGDNGTPAQSTSSSTATTSLTHVVYTRKTCIDGSEDVSGSISGDFSTWNSSYKFALANELTNNRDWLGELHLVAVYDRDLSSSDVRQNFNAGP